MTTKDYKLIAEIIRDARKANMSYYQLELLLAERLQQANERFNKDKFKKDLYK